MQQQLKKVELLLDDIQNQNNTLYGDKAILEKDKEETKNRCSKNSEELASMVAVDVDEFENNNSDLLLVDLNDIDARQKIMQSDIDNKIKSKQNEMYKKQNACKSKMMEFKRPSEEITAKYADWRSDVNTLPDSVEFVSEYQAFLKRLNDENLPSFEKKFNKYLHETIITNVSAFRQFFMNWESSINKTIEQLNSYLRDIDFNVGPQTYIQLECTKKRNADINEFIQLLHNAIPNLHEINSKVDGQRIHFEQRVEPLMQRLQAEQWRTNVLDVRGWFTYKAVEYYKANMVKRNTFESMGQLSGGERPNSLTLFLVRLLHISLALLSMDATLHSALLPLTRLSAHRTKTRPGILSRSANSCICSYWWLHQATIFILWRTTSRMFIMWSEKATYLYSTICL